MHFDKLGRAIEMKKSRRRFSSEFKLEAALLVVDQGYAVREAAEVMSVGKDTFGWLHFILAFSALGMI